jgi:hypothetical protein
MKLIALGIFFTALAFGFYFNQSHPDQAVQSVIEDQISDRVSAPQRAEIPL